MRCWLVNPPIASFQRQSPRSRQALLRTPQCPDRDPLSKVFRADVASQPPKLVGREPGGITSTVCKYQVRYSKRQFTTTLCSACARMSSIPTTYPSRGNARSIQAHSRFEIRICCPLEIDTFVVCPTTWELFRGISFVNPLTGMAVIVMSCSVIFFPAARSVAAMTTSIRSSVLSRKQDAETNASRTVITVSRVRMFGFTVIPN